MKYYISKAFFPVVYLFLTAITGSMAVSLSNDLIALKIIMEVVNISIYTYLVIYFSFKTGEESIRTRMHNDNVRREIIRTGKDLPIKYAEEYKPYKGFLIGFLSSVPLVVLWVLHFIVIAINGGESSVFSGIVMLFYMMIIAFFNLNTESIQGVQGFYYTALYIPYIVLLWGIFYFLGAKKADKNSAQILKKQKELYGDKE